MKNLIVTFTLSCLVLFSVDSFAVIKKTQKCDINIKDRKFISGDLEKVAGEECRFQLKAEKTHRLTFCNVDKLPAEVESHDLKIEKIIKGESIAKITIKALEKGKIYKIEEEFSETHCEIEGI